MLAMPDLPEHTKRLLFAQAMLNKQRVMNDECERLIRARRVDLLKRRDVKRREALEARALEEDLARRGAEVDKTLGDAERTMNAKRGFRNVARHLSSMRNLSLVQETEPKESEKSAPAKSSFARSKREAQANASGTAAVRRITGGTARATRATTRTIPVMFGDASATDWRLPRRRTLCAWRRTHRRRALSANSRKQSTT